MSVATNIMTWVATLDAGQAKAAGASLTLTVHLTQGWEIQIPFRVYHSAYSIDPGIYVYRSTDGGTNYDSEAFTAFAISGASQAIKTRSVVLTTGQYALEMRCSSPTCTFMVLTQAVITGISIV